jgi:hypothetical protein
MCRCSSGVHSLFVRTVCNSVPALIFFYLHPVCLLQPIILVVCNYIYNLTNLYFFLASVVILLWPSNVAQNSFVRLTILRCPFPSIFNFKPALALKCLLILDVPLKIHEARRSVVDWGTMLQGGRSRVRFTISLFDFSTDLILPAALWSWVRLSL